jgi:outer membrane protein
MTAAWITLVLALSGEPLTLEQALRAAEAHQPELRESRALRDAAESRTDQARAPLWPQIAATAAYRRTTGNRVLRAGTDPRLLDRQPRPVAQLWDVYNFGVTATQLVYDFGQTPGALRSAGARAASQRASERATWISVMAGVRVSFFSALAEKQLVQVLNDALDNQKRHLRQVEAFVQVKAKPELDLVQARLESANVELQLLAAENAYATAKAELNFAMGIEGSIDYEVARARLEPIVGEDGSTDALLSEAMSTRAEFVALAEQVRAEEALVGAARGAYGPTLSVGAGATEAGVGLDHLRWNYFGQVTLSWPLFQGMLTPARVSEARANVAASEARLDALRLRIRLDVEKARLALRTAKATMGTAERALFNANERLRLAEGRYTAGVGNAIELGDAILAHTSAATQKVQAEYLVSVARAELLQALGRP